MIDKMQIWPWAKKMDEKIDAKVQTFASIGAEIQASLTESLRDSHRAAEGLAAINAELDAFEARGRA